VIEDRGDVKHPMGIEMYLVGLSNGKADVQTTPLGHQSHKIRFAFDMTIYIDLVCAASVNMAHPRAAHHGMWRLEALDHLAFNNLKISALGG